LISLSIFFSVNDVVELYQSDFDAVATRMRVALHRVRTTIISQLVGVNKSAVPSPEKIFRRAVDWVFILLFNFL
jgi:hypothetical protein